MGGVGIDVPEFGDVFIHITISQPDLLERKYPQYIVG